MQSGADGLVSGCCTIQLWAAFWATSLVRKLRLFGLWDLFVPVWRRSPSGRRLKAPTTTGGKAAGSVPPALAASSHGP